MARWLWVLVLLPSWCALPAQEVPRPAAERATVATHYFYWYRHPDQHFPRPGGEGHKHHFVAPEQVSYLSAAWHRGEFRDMAATGIDVALPVYWGCEGCERRAGLRFADAGLPAMVEALDAMARDGEAAPKLGLFYDTSTLLSGVRGLTPPDQRADLTSEPGRELFIGTVLRFFAAVPPRHRALHRGRPLVVLYVSGFAQRWDASLGDRLREAFVDRFGGESPFLVADASWGELGQDATTSWGAALHGPRLFEGVAQIGPGYDDSPVPGRHTPVRPREDGAFYLASWRAAIAHRPGLVLIETWNEMHEGTEICRSEELGDRYLELTRDAIGRLHRGEPGPEIALEFAVPKPRPDLSWGEEFATDDELSWAVGRPRGLRPIVVEDGPITRDGRSLVARCPDGRPVTYIYLQVSDHWAFDLPDDGRELLLTVHGRNLKRLRVEYDSHDRGATLDGAYTMRRARSHTDVGFGGVDEELTFVLPRPRLADRQNGGADLRFLVQSGRVELRALQLAMR